MPEWLVEKGIGETRAALVEGGAIIEARIELDGVVAAGSVISAQLIDVGRDGRNAIAKDDLGTEYLLPRGAAGVAEGAPLNIRVTREPIPGPEPWKRPLAEAAPDSSVQLRPLTGRDVLSSPTRDPLADAGWNEVIEEARYGIVTFDGGMLRIWPTPAMTLIDIDGYLDPQQLAMRGASEAAGAIRRLGITGSIGIDFPTVRNRLVRAKATDAIDRILPQPFERTAVNGFGFMQIVRPRPRASLVELAQDRASFEARALLRRVTFEDVGPRRLVCHPAIIAIFEQKPGWIDALAGQVGGGISLRADPALPISGGYAEQA